MDNQRAPMTTGAAAALPSSRRKPVVGLIGGMGSGKSTVAEEFAHCGARVIGGDELGHEALCQPEIRARLIERWGSRIVNAQGEIDRRSVGAIVFANTEERRALEAQVFPWIERRFREEVASAQDDPVITLVLFDAAIMLETGWNEVCDWLVYVHAPRAVRLNRLAKQRGWSEQEVEARESAQLSLTEKVSRADFAIDNSASRAQTAQRIGELAASLKCFRPTKLPH